MVLLGDTSTLTLLSALLLCASGTAGTHAAQLNSYRGANAQTLAQQPQQQVQPARVLSRRHTQQQQQQHLQHARQAPASYTALAALQERSHVTGSRAANQQWQPGDEQAVVSDEGDSLQQQQEEEQEQQQKQEQEQQEAEDETFAPCYKWNGFPVPPEEYRLSPRGGHTAWHDKGAASL